jgi:hypothetical protein
VKALVRMRLIGYIRTGRFIIPLIGALVLLTILYGGGQTQLTELYGVSALLLFPVLAWQTKLMLDAEPDAQRRIAITALGSQTGELVAGLAAAALAGLPLIVLSLLLPWLFGAATGANAGSGLLLGLWAHLLVVPPALAVGGLASRMLTRTAGRGAAVLASGVVLAFVLGLRDSPLIWLAPPLVATDRMMTGTAGAGAVLGLTVWALLWSTVALAGYGWLRRTRT